MPRQPCKLHTVCQNFVVHRHRSLDKLIQGRETVDLFTSLLDAGAYRSIWLDFVGCCDEDRRQEDAFAILFDFCCYSI